MRFCEKGAMARALYRGGWSLDPPWTITWSACWTKAITRRLAGFTAPETSRVVENTSVLPTPVSERGIWSPDRVISEWCPLTSSSMRMRWNSPVTVAVCEYIVAVAVTAPVAGSKESTSIRIGHGSKALPLMMSM